VNRIEAVVEGITSPHIVRVANKKDGSQRGAVFSLYDPATDDDAPFRYLLWDIWDEVLPIWAFIMMNPSEATHLKTDPTVTRQRTRARNGGAGGIVIMNSGAIRDPYSTNLKNHADCIGPYNREWIAAVAPVCDNHICGWGKEAMRFGGAQMVAGVFKELGITLKGFAVNKAGTPKHTLYVGYDVVPIPYTLPEGKP